jgi:iron complex transport system substrate-binding protein
MTRRAMLLGLMMAAIPGVIPGIAPATRQDTRYRDYRSARIGLLSPAARQAVPRRIISLVPAVTEMLFAMGAGPAVVGVSSFDRFPPEVARLPRVGALVDPDFERVLSLRPDLVIVYGSQTELTARLARASVDTYAYRDSTLADVLATIRHVGARVGRRAEADSLALSIERDLEILRTNTVGRPRPTVALIFDREPGALRGMYASGGRGFLHDVLVAAGGTNAFGDVDRDGLQVTSETLLARRPDVIIELAPSTWTPARLADERQVWQTLSAIPAVRNGRLQILADSSLSIPGPRLAQTARVLAEAIRAAR